VGVEGPKQFLNHVCDWYRWP